MQMGNMNSSSNLARGAQGLSNAANGSASWSDQRRSGELLDAYISAPSRLSQDTSIHPGWNPSIDSLSKLEWGQLIAIERETARWLNQSRTYMVNLIMLFILYFACICNLTCCFSGSIRKQNHLATGCKAKNRRLVQSSCWSTHCRSELHSCKSAVHIDC